MITTLLLDKENKLKENIPLENIRENLSDSKSFLWMDIEDPDEKEFKILCDLFNFHPLSIEDCSHYTDLPKFDNFEEYLFIIVHGVQFEKDWKKFRKHELDIFVGKNYLVTIHRNGMKTIEMNLGRIRKNPALLSKGPDFMFYNVMDFMIDRYMPLLDIIESRIEELEDDVISGSRKDVLPDIIRNKRVILSLKRSVVPQRDIINKIARQDSQLISAKHVIYFRDIYDHIVRINELLDTNRERLASIFEIYLSSISNRMNNIMKRLTVVATIFMPLTLIAGIYGMNFNTGISKWNMPELNWPYGYVGVLGLMVVIVSGMLFYFKKKKWF